MPPRDADNIDPDFSDFDKDTTGNADLIPHAGKVTIGKCFLFSAHPKNEALSCLTMIFFSEPGQPWGRGFIADVKRTVGTHWKEEMTNLNQRTVAVSLLIFITVIAPTLTFGAVYGTNTENSIGAVETILATSWMGCFFALFSGMPTVRSQDFRVWPGHTRSYLTRLIFPTGNCRLHWTRPYHDHCNL